MATCTHVADFYVAMKFVFAADTMMMYVMLRTGWNEQSPFYKVFIVASLLYELYVILGARRVYEVRQRQKTLEKASASRRQSKKVVELRRGQRIHLSTHYPLCLVSFISPWESVPCGFAISFCHSREQTC